MLKIPFFQNQILRGCFNQAPQQHHFCTVNSLSMLQESLGYAINKFDRFYRVPEKKIVIFKKIKKLKNLGHELEQQLFYQKLFLIQNFDYRSTKWQKELGFCLIVKRNTLLVYWTGVNIITYGKSSGVPLNILSSV